MEEIQEWFDLYGYENSHQITKEGRIRSKDRQSKTKNGYMFLLSKEISQCLSKSGYVRTMLTHNNITRCFAVHRLVALTFLPNTENKPTVNHKNGIKHDNRVENLEWMTSQENNLHSYRELGNVSKLRGRLNFTATKIVIQVDPITGEEMREFLSGMDAARFFGSKNGDGVCLIARGKGHLKTAFGYKWKYKNKSDKQSNSKL